MNPLNERIAAALHEREAVGSLRTLKVIEGLVDFSSNDYLSMATRINTTCVTSHRFGSTGSRLLTGNSHHAETLEKKIAAFHSAATGLIFNSGYDANVGLLSCIAQRTDTIIFDQLAHASIRDGIRLSLARAFHFRHNDLDDLKKKMRQASGHVFVVVESVYSMDGDSPDLVSLAALTSSHDASLIVDEAHATGVFGNVGEGLISALGLESQCTARIHTFGKALGCHGAIVLGSESLRQFLINFSRSFIYTTFLPDHSLHAIEQAYDLLSSALIGELRHVIDYFKSKISGALFDAWIPSNSAIQCFVIPGNKKVKKAAALLAEAGFDVRPVLHPTVPKEKERLRICLHAFNTEEQIDNLMTELARQ